MGILDEIFSSLVIIFYLMLGLCMGSFASAISYRIQHGLSWVFSTHFETKKKNPARSVCTSCKHQLSFFDLIPLLSWICSAGRCRYCHTKISFRYPLVEIGGALIVIGYFLLGIRPLEMFILILLLPFLLSFILLIINRYHPPNYIYVALLLNILVLVYSVVEV